MGKTIGLILALKDQCSPQLSKVADKIGITEKEAKKLNTQIGRLSKDLGGKLKSACTAVGVGLTAVVAGAGVLANKAIEAGDRIDKMSQKIGMSRQAFQEWEYVMSQNGGDVEKLQMGYKALANQMEMLNKGSKDSIGYFKKLGVNVKDSHGQFRKQEDVFNDTVRALQSMKNPTEKAIIANKLFGKSAIDMKPLLNQSAESVDALRKRANDLGMVMSDDAVNSAVKLKDTIDTIQRTFTAFGNMLMADLMPSIQSLADELIVHLPQIKSALTPVFQGLTNVVKFLITHFNGLVAIGSVVVGTFVAFNVINGVISTIATLRAIIQAVTIAQGIWNAVMIANPIGLIATGIGLLIGGIVLLVQNWDKVTNAVKKAVDAMKSFVGIKNKSNVETPDVKVKKNALGTSFSTGGTTLVGEHGAELVNLPQGASVTNANNTAKAFKSGNGINIQVVIQGNMIGNNEFLDKMGNVFAQKLKVAMAVK